MIYAIRAVGTKYIKFGTTSESNVRDRLGMLQTGCPFELELLAVGVGGRDEEQQIHRSLKDAGKHHSREWFVESLEVNQVVEWIKDRTKKLPDVPPLKPGRGRLARVKEYAALIDIERSAPRVRKSAKQLALEELRKPVKNDNLFAIQAAEIAHALLDAEVAGALNGKPVHQRHP